MQVLLKPKNQKFVEQKLRTGKYRSAEEVVQAAFAALEQQEMHGDFKVGELNELLKEGERSIKRKGVIDADEVFAELRRDSAKLRRARN